MTTQEKKKFISLIPLPMRIKAWFWWHFRATEKDKMDFDIEFYGGAISKNGKRIDPKKFELTSPPAE